MIFSQSCQYAIKSCIYLAQNRRKIDVVEIAEYINSPIPFTSKVLQKLAKKNHISSSKGRSGGFFLNDEQYQNLSTKDIYLCIENETKFYNCALGISRCNNNDPCPIHDLAKEMKDKICLLLGQKIRDIKNNGRINFL